MATFNAEIRKEHHHDAREEKGGEAGFLPKPDQDTERPTNQFRVFGGETIRILWLSAFGGKRKIVL